MTSSTAATPKVQFCSVISVESGESSFGSASHTRRRLMIELPLPWKKPAFESPNAAAGFSTIVRGLWDRGIYPAMTMIAPDEAWSVAGQTRIIEYRLPDPPFATFAQREYLLPTDRVAELVEPLLRDEHGDSLDEFRQASIPGCRDYMICTHGAIDACCAKFGYPIYKMLRMMANNPDHNMRVWRCTHFGGHRFAPTLVEMPSGRYWGHLEARDLGPLVRRELPRDLIRKRYRGWAALPSGAAQQAECELFAQAGWDWTETLVTPAEAPLSAWNKSIEEAQTMMFTFSHPGRGIDDAAVEVVVTPNGSVPTAHSSGTEIEYRDAQQFVATVTATNVREFFELPEQERPARGDRGATG